MKCSHKCFKIFRFTGLDEDGQIKALDPWNDQDNNGGAMKRFTNLKEKNSKLITLVAIGGKYSIN